MDPRHGPGLLSTLIPGTYARQGAEALVKRQKLVTSLLSERRIPKHGWDDASIENLLQVSRFLQLRIIRQCNTMLLYARVIFACW